jgi:hypothetical protein
MYRLSQLHREHPRLSDDDIHASSDEEAPPPQQSEPPLVPSDLFVKGLGDGHMDDYRRSAAARSENAARSKNRPRSRSRSRSRSPSPSPMPQSHVLTVEELMDKLKQPNVDFNEDELATFARYNITDLRKSAFENVAKLFAIVGMMKRNADKRFGVMREKIDTHPKIKEKNYWQMRHRTNDLNNLYDALIDMRRQGGKKRIYPMHMIKNKKTRKTRKTRRLRMLRMAKKRRTNRK